MPIPKVGVTLNDGLDFLPKCGSANGSQKKVAHKARTLTKLLSLGKELIHGKMTYQKSHFRCHFHRILENAHP